MEGRTEMITLGGLLEKLANQKRLGKETMEANKGEVLAVSFHLFFFIILKANSYQKANRDKAAGELLQASAVKKHIAILEQLFSEPLPPPNQLAQQKKEDKQDSEPSLESSISIPSNPPTPANKDVKRKHALNSDGSDVEETPFPKLRKTGSLNTPFGFTPPSNWSWGGSSRQILSMLQNMERRGEQADRLYDVMKDSTETTKKLTNAFIKYLNCK